MAPGLKQFRQEGCLSYLLYDAAAKACAVIDPRADLVEEYRQYMAERGLRLVLAIDTRVHWHHLSGTHWLADAFGAPIAMSRLTASRRVTRKLSDGERIEVGSYRFEVIESPGVSPDAISLYGEGLLFSGDTIVPASGARVDLPGADPSALWTTLRSRMATLPGSTVVLSGQDVQDLLFSTIDREKKDSPDWLPRDSAEFIRVKGEERTPRGDGDIRRRIEHNLAAHPEATPESHFGGTVPHPGRGEARGMASISVEKYALKIKEHLPENCFLDVREAEEFAAGHIPGARNIPLSELALRWQELRAFKRVYVSDQTGVRSLLATRTLDYLGLPEVVHVTGGLRAWESLGFSLE